ncbi:MAG: hypothetical protein ASARMPRED_002881 [Alectoria sarmentosa]|nr:MAG: hypothetical protein ASARMPRED_002881 [Alectoria sarmentosa]
MTSTQLNLIAPIDTPLPPPPDGQVLTESQWTTLMAIADAVIPSIEVSSTLSNSSLCIAPSEYTSTLETIAQRIPAQTDPSLTQRFLRENASSVPGFRELVGRILGNYIREDARKGIRVILSTLDTRAGCLLATGYRTSYHLQPVNVRQQILQGWAKSYLPPLKQSAMGLESLLISAWARTSPTVGPILGFPRAPVHGKPGKGFDYNFLQLPPGVGPEILETDVIIVGSGCGGAVCAKNLAEAGHRVMVLEKAYHWGPEYLPMSEKDGPIHLFANGGVDSSDDSSIVVLSGQSWGGGGTINWSASLQTQAFVRKEWADAGLPFFTSSEFQDSLDRVCHRMGVSTKHVEHNKNNQILADGARKLGYSQKTVPQNSGGNKHHCGYCTLGCGAAEKQGPVVSFLPDAQIAGAQFIEGLQVEKVLFDHINGKRTAVGVTGSWKSRDSSGGVNGPDRTTREVIIKAKRVIISSGSLESPLLLLRSGLKNPQIGRNLYLHPAAMIYATFPDQKPIKPWEGAILTSLVDEFQNLDGNHHGVKLECTTMLPSWLLASQPWTGGLDLKMFASKLPYMTGQFPIVREKVPGRVYPDPTDGRCRIAYTPTAMDAKHAMVGIVALAKILYLEGAKEIFLGTAGMPRFTRPEVDANADDGKGINNPEFQSWLADVQKKGLALSDCKWASAHQMGTCRMAVTPRAGVVDPRGRVWGVEGLYVSDSSVFPSASGVNPMVTNMAISDWISKGLAKDLSAETKIETRARL